MWCSLNEVKRAGNAAGFQEAREFLYRSATAPTSKSIDEEVVEEAELMNNGKSVDWLQDCYWLCSPAMELIVLLRLDKAVVINCSPALTTAGGDLTIKEKFTFDHNVVAATILPIVGGSRKSESRPFDWCCLVVGYECGQLEFYSISPQIKRVYHIRYSAAPIRSIRTSSPQAELQELAVLYSDCLVVIDGLSLLTTLKACRSQIAFQQVASKEDLSAVADLVFKVRLGYYA